MSAQPGRTYCAGLRYRLISPVDVENCFVGTAGDLCTILKVEHGWIWLKPDAPQDALDHEDWEGCYMFSTDANECRAIEDYAEMLPPPPVPASLQSQWDAQERRAAYYARRGMLPPMDDQGRDLQLRERLERWDDE